MFHFPLSVSAALALIGAAGDPPAPSAAESRVDWFVVPSQDDSPHSHRAGNGWYIQLGAGLTTTQESDGPDEEIDFDEGYAIPLAFGHRFAADDGNAFAFELEAEGIWSDQDADATGVLEAVSDVTILGALVNGIADFGITDAFSLYGGGGIGLAALDAGTESDALNDFDEEDGPFLTWQAKAGLRWWAGARTSVNLGYRFLNVDDAEIDDDLGGAEFDLETQQHIVELGLRWSLGG